MLIPFRAFLIGTRVDRGERSLKAYVLIQTDEHSEPIAQTLRAISGVACAEDLGGPFDAIALAGSDSTAQMMEGIVARIRDLPGVLRVLPAPLIRSLSEGAAPSREGHEAA
jgi:hypothetical protein